MSSGSACPDLYGALCGYTREDDTRAVLTLLVHARPRRVLEIGTALGHMTANLTRWTDEEARVFTIDLVRGMSRAAPGAAEQQVEVPGHADWGRFANHFGTAHKAFFITADSMTYDFGRIAPLDFAFIDGGHDFEHVLNDSRKVYEALAPGGWMVWHDFDSPVPWVKVREAIERSGFSEPVVHVQGTEVAFLQKGRDGSGEPVDQEKMIQRTDQESDKNRILSHADPLEPVRNQIAFSPCGSGGTPRGSAGTAG